MDFDEHLNTSIDLPMAHHEVHLQSLDERLPQTVSRTSGGRGGKGGGARARARPFFRPFFLAQYRDVSVHLNPIPIPLPPLACLLTSFARKTPFECFAALSQCARTAYISRQF